MSQQLCRPMYFLFSRSAQLEIPFLEAATVAAISASLFTSLSFVDSARASASEVAVNSEQVTVSTSAADLDVVLGVQLKSPLEFDCLISVPPSLRLYCSSQGNSSSLISDQIKVPFVLQSPTNEAPINFDLQNDSTGLTNLRLFEIRF